MIICSAYCTNETITEKMQGPHRCHYSTGLKHIYYVCSAEFISSIGHISSTGLILYKQVYTVIKAISFIDYTFSEKGATTNRKTTVFTTWTQLANDREMENGYIVATLPYKAYTRKNSDITTEKYPPSINELIRGTLRPTKHLYRQFFFIRPNPSNGKLKSNCCYIHRLWVFFLKMGHF